MTHYSKALSSRDNTVLIVCTGNACRSQMAEAIWKDVAGNGWKVMSAGTMPASVHPMARRVIEEQGIDMSGYYSKSVFDIDVHDFAIVITVCDDAKDQCFHVQGHPGHVHWSIEDPVRATTDMITIFRRIRDDIRQRIVNHLSEMENGTDNPGVIET